MKHRSVKKDELSLFSYEILGLVGRTGAGAHDLLRLARRGRMLDWAGESQYYAEPKRLARLGYLEARREPGKTRERTVYRLTDKGLDALRTYAATPARFTPLKSEPLLRLLIADLVGEDVTCESLVALRDELVDLHERLDLSVETAAALPHRSTNLLIVIDFLRRYLHLHEDLIDRVERELAPPARQRAGS
jgi:DNA-binding PadR family transcriptional regulator